MFKRFIILSIILCTISNAQNIDDAKKYLNISQIRDDNQKSYQTRITTSSSETKILQAIEQLKILIKSGQNPLQNISSGVIDSNYILGPGDFCALMIKGKIDQFYTAYVAVDGSFLIPGIGAVKVGNKNLGRVKSELKEIIEKTIPGNEFYFVVLQPRKFKIYITGEVEKPGMYQIDATDRLQAAFEQCMGPSAAADLKHVIIKYNNNADTVNYEKFLFYGEIAGNPFLKDGCVLYVPKVILTNNKVMLKGLTKHSGYYNIQEGEKLSHFIKRISSISDETVIDMVYIKSGDKMEIVDLKTTDYILKNNDIIFVPSSNDYIYVGGEVTYPGAYPYIPGLTAVDYIGMAGGVKYNGVTGKYWLFRNGKMKKYSYKRSDIQIFPGDKILIKQQLIYTIKDYFQVIATAGSVIMTYLAATKQR